MSHFVPWCSGTFRAPLPSCPAEPAALAMQSAKEHTPPAGLPDWWASAPDGQLSPWALAQVWALLRASGEFGLELSDQQIAEQVTKAGGGHPTKQRIQQFRVAVASDPLWYPGKVRAGAKKRGPKPKLTEGKRLGLAQSAMSLKSNGIGP